MNQNDGFLMDFLVFNSSHSIVSMPNDGFTQSISKQGPIMNLLPRLYYIISTCQDCPDKIKPPCIHPRIKWVGLQLECMTDRITAEVIRISEVGEEPQMDSARIAGIAKLDDEKWRFRTKLDHLVQGDVIRAIVERTEDEEGRYLRIHEILKNKNTR